MLNTQVEYWKLQETKRHNAVSEGFSYAQLAEDTRHHQADERQNYYSYLENSRHNRSTEDIGYRNVDLGYANLSELSTHNRAMESIGETQARASMISANASQAHARAALISANASVMQAQAAQTTAAAALQNASTNSYEAQIKRDELTLAQTKAPYENMLTRAKTATERAKRKEASSAAEANRARKEYTDIQSSWYAVDEIRSWVPIVNLGGKK